MVASDDRLSRLSGFLRLFPSSEKRDDSHCNERSISQIGPYGCVPFWCFCLSMVCLFVGIAVINYYDRRFSFQIAAGIALMPLPVRFRGRISCEKEKCEEDESLHSGTFKLRHHRRTRNETPTNFIDLKSNARDNDYSIGAVSRFVHQDGPRSCPKTIFGGCKQHKSLFRNILHISP